jgi:hypothetical protein
MAHAEKSATETATNPHPQNYIFRHFLFEFFNDQTFQVEHIKFPLQHIYTDGEYEEHTEQIERSNWKHVQGPQHYRCEMSCFDIIIYDNFEKKYDNYTERVLSFEGIENGINSSMYFIYENGKWMLVKWENVGT